MQAGKRVDRYTIRDNPAGMFVRKIRISEDHAYYFACHKTYKNLSARDKAFVDAIPILDLAGQGVKVQLSVGEYGVFNAYLYRSQTILLSGEDREYFFYK